MWNCDAHQDLLWPITILVTGGALQKHSLTRAPVRTGLRIHVTSKCTLKHNLGIPKVRHLQNRRCLGTVKSKHMCQSCVQMLRTKTVPEIIAAAPCRLTASVIRHTRVHCTCYADRSSLHAMSNHIKKLCILGASLNAVVPNSDNMHRGGDN